MTVLSSDISKLERGHARLLQTLGLPGEKFVGPTPQNTIPVTILSGFLGAGKTTLLTRLLEQRNLTITAIVNDIAAINVDAKLIRATGTDTLELDNGCACCVLGDDLTEALDEIASRETSPDAVVIETSGLSDPQGFALSIARHPSMTLDGILVLVDVRTASGYMGEPETRELMLRQIDCAHIIGLTHLHPGDERDAVGELLADFAPGRAVVELTNDIDPSEIMLGAALRGARPTPTDQRHATDQWYSEVVSFPGPIDSVRLSELVTRIPPEVLRIKGTFRSLSKGTQALQSVGRYWQISKAPPSSDQLVVIGIPGHSLAKFVSELHELVI